MPTMAKFYASNRQFPIFPVDNQFDGLLNHFRGAINHSLGICRLPFWLCSFAIFIIIPIALNNRLIQNVKNPGFRHCIQKPDGSLIFAVGITLYICFIFQNSGKFGVSKNV